MIACSKVHVSRGFSIFGNAFNTTFVVSHGFVTPIKGCRVTDSFMSLVGLSFWWMCMARHWRMLPVPGFLIALRLNVMLTRVGWWL